MRRVSYHNFAETPSAEGRATSSGGRSVQYRDIEVAPQPLSNNGFLASPDGEMLDFGGSFIGLD